MVKAGVHMCTYIYEQLTHGVNMNASITSLWGRYLISSIPHLSQEYTNTFIGVFLRICIDALNGTIID